MNVGNIGAAAYDSCTKRAAESKTNAGNSNFAANVGKGHTVYMMTPERIYSGGNGTGLSFYIEYAKESSEDNPIVIAKGVDENGQEFEQTIPINDINPKNASLVEMQALGAHYKADKDMGLTFLPHGTGNMRLHDRRNFFAMFEKEIEDMQKLGRYDSAAFLEKNFMFYQKLQKKGSWTAEQTFPLEAYCVKTALAVHNVKSAYEAYESENYRVVPDNEAECFDIYNKQGEWIGAFDYADIKVRQDSRTGKQFLISEHGTMGYDAMPVDEELKETLQNVMGVKVLETEELSGFTLKTHSGTGIQYLVREGEEGRGGKVLLQSQADIEKYEALAETYFSKYPNLVHDKNAAYIWADLEIKGLAQHTNDGIVSIGFDGMSYHDNTDYKNNWSVLFSGDTYKAVFDWLQNAQVTKEQENFSRFAPNAPDEVHFSNTRYTG